MPTRQPLPTASSLETPSDTLSLAATAIVAASLPNEQDEATLEVGLSTRAAFSESAANREIQTLSLLLEQEKTAHAVQRATAEQARRVADCLRAFHTNLLAELAQPSLTLNQEGIVTEGNPALTEWLGIPEAQLRGESLQHIVDAPHSSRLASILRSLRTQPGSASETASASILEGPLALPNGRIASCLRFLALCRIPGCVEAVVVLIEPETGR